MTLTPEICHASFLICLMEAINNPDFVAQFNRLQGRRLGMRHATNPMDAAIDKATGYDQEIERMNDEDMVAFADCVRDTIWSRLPPETLIEMSAL